MSQSQRDQVALACRMLALEGYSDLTLGHVSARDADPDVIHIKRKGPALEEVEADDVVALRLDDPDAYQQPGVHLETVLHTEVYRSRSDVGAVIHGHPPYGTALAATSGRVEMVTHDAALFVEGVGVYDGTSEMITNPEQGAEVAKALGHCRVALLRNHGVLVTGQDLRWAVLAAVTFERAVQLQTIAHNLGEFRPIDPSILPRLHQTKYQDHFLDEYWSSWERAVALAERSGALPRRTSGEAP